MELSFKGANCVEITTKKKTFVTDNKLSSVGLKDDLPKDAVYIATLSGLSAAPEGALLLDGPGEYEVSDVSIVGVAARAHHAAGGEKDATVFRLTSQDITVVVVGHIAAPLSEQQLEEIGVVDIAIVPVGGSGYTLDSHGAVDVVKQLDPRVVIPTHYADPAVRYEVPQLDLAPFLSELSATHETTAKYKLKTRGDLPEQLTVVELTRSS